MDRHNTVFLGLDTSNYTTSCALFDANARHIWQQKQLLPVAAGERGLRQSDALFQHTKQLPNLMRELFSQTSSPPLRAVGVSARPRDVEGSYMPCFLAGISVAESLAAALHLPCYRFSHQAGHVAAALFSAGQLQLLGSRFLAFHLSGGTTELLYVEPGEGRLPAIARIGGSLDLNAGQLIDRIGVKLGLSFPCGKEMDILSRRSARSFHPKLSVRDLDCNLSGLENQCEAMLERGESPEDISRFCLESLCAVILALAQNAGKRYGALPLLFSGGVACNTLLRQTILSRHSAFFASPEFSADNAAGAAILAYLQQESENG